MQLLKDTIINRGQVKDGDVVKVDSFLNHQIDTKLVDAMADEWIKRIDTSKATKIITIETSGIAVAYPVAQKLGLPLVIAKKKDSVNLAGDQFSSKVISYTHFREYDVIVSKKFLSADDNVIIIDDVLANGSALKGLLAIIKQAQANVIAIGIGLEKSFQPCASELREQGYRIESLAKIQGIDPQTNSIVFAD